MKRLIIILLLLFSFAHKANAQTSVTLAWNASSIATGYNLAYGSSSGNYTVSTNVGNVTQSTVLLLPGTYFFAVNAYNLSGTSSYSNEVSDFISQTNNCTPITGIDNISIFPTAIMYTGSKGAGSRFRVDFQVASPNSPVTHIALQSNGVNINSIDGIADGTNITNLAGLWSTIPMASGNYPLSILASNAFCTQVQSTTFTLIVP